MHQRLHQGLVICRQQEDQFVKGDVGRLEGCWARRRRRPRDGLVLLEWWTLRLDVGDGLEQILGGTSRDQFLLLIEQSKHFTVMLQLIAQRLD